MQKADHFDNWVISTRARLAARRNTRPSTKIGAVRALWPEIKQALQSGQTLKTICDWLEDEGVSLRYSQFRTYVCRIRRAPPAGFESATVEVRPEAKLYPVALERQPVQARDPLANLRKAQRTHRTFEYNADFKEEDLL
jgi:hypothetical protein